MINLEGGKLLAHGFKKVLLIMLLKEWQGSSVDGGRSLWTLDSREQVTEPRAEARGNLHSPPW